MIILGIESSCDDTAAAALKGEAVCSNIIRSHLSHQAFGGVVPELASREHDKLIVSVVEAALSEARIKKSEIDVVAATAGPGLVGAVLVGLNFAQAFAFMLQKPFAPINHIEAHIFSNFIEPPFPKFPFVSLTVSGGHTLLAIVQADFSCAVVGKTIDDAAGEAFDKTGKMLGLGYPAGAAIDRLAKSGNPEFHKFPRALVKGYDGNFDFSFSGLKTSVQTFLAHHSPDFIDAHRADICASIQEAITSVLVLKTIRLAELRGITTISVAGGVSANSDLRRKFERASAERGFDLHIPKPIYSTDNAAMIASLARLKLERGLIAAERRYSYGAFAAFSYSSSVFLG
jgi:N6-L-threonylcarbamoyladenine synthase